MIVRIVNGEKKIFAEVNKVNTVNGIGPDDNSTNVTLTSADIEYADWTVDAELGDIRNDIENLDTTFIKINNIPIGADTKQRYIVTGLLPVQGEKDNEIIIKQFVTNAEGTSTTNFPMKIKGDAVGDGAGITVELDDSVMGQPIATIGVNFPEGIDVSGKIDKSAIEPSAQDGVRRVVTAVEPTPIFEEVQVGIDDDGETAIYEQVLTGITINHHASSIETDAVAPDHQTFDVKAGAGIAIEPIIVGAGETEKIGGISIENTLVDDVEYLVENAITEVNEKSGPGPITLYGSDIKIDSTSTKTIAQGMNFLRDKVNVDPNDEILSWGNKSGDRYLKSELSIDYTAGVLTLYGKSYDEKGKDGDGNEIVVSQKTEIGNVNIALGTKLVYSGFHTKNTSGPAPWTPELPEGAVAPEEIKKGDFLVLGFSESDVDEDGGLPNDVKYSFVDLSNLIKPYGEANGIRIVDNQIGVRLDKKSLNNLSVSDDGVRFNIPILTFEDYEKLDAGDRKNNGVYFVEEEVIVDEPGDDGESGDDGDNG